MAQDSHLAKTSDHTGGRRPGSRRNLWIALVLIASYMVVEVAGGLAAGSLALLADAGHMLTDAAAIGLALLAMWLASRPASSSRTYGFHRSEIVAALLNALALWLISVWIFVEAYRRFSETPEVQGSLVLAVGLVGLIVNAGAAWVLRGSAGESLNVEGAFLHVLGDLLGSIGVVMAGVLVIFFDWYVADAVFGVLIGLLVLLNSVRLLWKVVHVLMEGTPAGQDLDRLCRRLEQVQGVTGVHDIHAWTITSGYEVLSAHVTADLAQLESSSGLLQSLREVASREFGIPHVTFQIEDSREGCREAHHSAHPEEAHQGPAGT